VVYKNKKLRERSDCSKACVFVRGVLGEVSKKASTSSAEWGGEGGRGKRGEYPLHEEGGQTGVDSNHWDRNLRNVGRGKKSRGRNRRF